MDDLSYSEYLQLRAISTKRKEPVTVTCPYCTVSFTFLSTGRIPVTCGQPECKRLHKNKTQREWRRRRVQQDPDFSKKQVQRILENSTCNSWWEYVSRNPNTVAKAAIRSRLKDSPQALCPELTEAEAQQILDMYKEMRRLNRQAGRVVCHVDHIIPLCKGGPHHPSNLQLISVEDHLAKTRQDLAS